MCGISRESNYINIARKPRCYEISATVLGGQNMRLGLEVTYIYCIKKGSIMTFGTALFLTEPFFA